MTSHDPLTTWSHEVTWQIKNKISPLLRSQWPINLSEWWFMMRETHPWWPSDHVIKWSPVTNWELKISSSTRSITTKHGRLGTYGERKPPMESQDPLSTWWGIVIMWQTKSVTYPLWQDLWPWNLASWWLMVTWMRPWRHIFPWPSAHMRSRDKLRKRNISSSRRRMATNFCRVLTYGKGKLIMKSHGSDHVIVRGHVSN